MSTGKKTKKNKTKKLTLQEFVQVPGGSGVTQVQVPAKLSWAEECVDEDDDKPNFPLKIIELPNAPRAARLLNDDLVPRNPPFMAYLSNLPYDANEDDLYMFFDQTQPVQIRLPRDDDSGKSKGYANVEFETREDLIDVLSIPDPVIHNRRIKIDLPNMDNDNRRDRRQNRYQSDFGGDRNNTNWRDRADQPSFQDRNNRYGGRGSRENRDSAPFDPNDAGSWRMGDRPTYSPPPERRHFDRPRGGDRGHGGDRMDRGGDRGDRPDRGDRGDRDRYGGRRREYEPRPPPGDPEAERPKLVLLPRSLPLPVLEFPKEEDLDPAAHHRKLNGDIKESSTDGEQTDESHPNDNAQEGDPDSEIGSKADKVAYPSSNVGDEGDVDGSTKAESVDGDHDENRDQPGKAQSPKPRGVPSAKVFGDAKPVDTAAKEREIEEKLRQREQEERQRLEEERKKAAEQKATESAGSGSERKLSEDRTDSRSLPPKTNDVPAWRKKDDDRPRGGRHYSPERDGRGPPRRNMADNRLRDRNFNRDNRDNKYGRDNRGYNNNRRGGGGNDYKRRDDRDRDRDHRMDNRGPREHRDSYRDQREPKEVGERMPKFKPSEGPNLSVSNAFAGLVDEQEDQEE